MDKHTEEKLKQWFPFLRITKDYESLVNIATIHPGKIIFQEGEPCEVIAFLLKGIIRVSKFGKNGKEVYLYRVKEGETCILMISSTLSGIGYPATATVEEEVEALLLPVPVFKKWLAENVKLQQFIYRTLSERLVSVMTLVEEIVFHRMDERVAELILEKGQERNILSITHDTIAMELGTAREVVSRIMKDFQRKGWVQLSRGKIEIVDRNGLELGFSPGVKKD